MQARLQKRLDEAASHRRAVEVQERAEYQRLKAKFEGERAQPGDIVTITGEGVGGAIPGSATDLSAPKYDPKIRQE